MESRVESKLRLEASLEGQVEPKWRLEANLDAKWSPSGTWRPLWTAIVSLECGLEASSDVRRAAWRRQVALGVRLGRRLGALQPERFPQVRMNPKPPRRTYG